MQVSFSIFEKFFSGKNSVVFLLVLLLITALAIIQDYLHAYFNDYNFYFSESLLYKSFWLLFIPTVCLQLFVIKKYRKNLPKEINVLTVLFVVVIFSLLHIALFAATVKLGSTIFFNYTYDFFQVVNYTIAEDFYKYILVYGTGVFMAWKISARDNIAPDQPQQTLPFLTMISVGNGKNYVTINTDEILFIDTASPYIHLHTLNGKFLHRETLKSMVVKLNNKQFLRVHKSTIVNLKMVKSYKSRLNGDYDIALENGEFVRMSRNFAGEFKEQFI
jgi:two-component system, LytTR family, response regulator